MYNMKPPVWLSDHGSFKYRKQIYSDSWEYRGSINSSNLSAQKTSTYGDGKGRPTEIDDRCRNTEPSFSAHKFESAQAGGHVNTLHPPPDSASFTDVTSPITTARTRPHPPLSFPSQDPTSRRRSEGGGYKVEKEVDKSTSMMAFWAQGEKATSDAQKDKNRVAILQKRLDDAMELLAEERRSHQDTRRKLESQHATMSDSNDL